MKTPNDKAWDIWAQINSNKLASATESVAVIADALFAARAEALEEAAWVAEEIDTNRYPEFLRPKIAGIETEIGKAIRALAAPKGGEG